MKQIIFLIASIVFISSGIFAQKNAITEVKIKTSAQCDMCKERIENGLYTQKGVVSAIQDLETKTLTIKYRAAKISVASLRLFISSLGYDADDIIADKNAHDHLPACCQVGSTLH